MNPFPPLLAAFGVADLIQVLVILLVFIVPVIGQLLKRIQQAPPAGGPRPQPPAPDGVADEIEDFLRRAVGQRDVQNARPRPAPQVAPPVEQPVQAEVVAALSVGERFDQRTKSHLGGDQFGDHASQLGNNVSRAGQQADQHLHQAFDHKLGQLATTPDKTAPPPAEVESPEDSEAVPVEVPPTFSVGLTALLASADSLPQAIMLSEILNRPEGRWE